MTSEKESVFRKFRTNPIYNLILEHVDAKQGQEYISEIEKSEPKFTEYEWEEFKEPENIIEEIKQILVKKIKRGCFPLKILSFLIL